MPPSERHPARYDEFADWYEDYVHGRARSYTQRTADALTRVLGPGSGPVLDVGCGTGVHAALLRSLGWTPAGLDVSTGQLRHALARLPVVAADATAPPLRPGTLAAIAAVMCHTDVDDYPAACRALAALLRPGGVFAHVGVHPCFTGPFADRSDPAAVMISAGYWNRQRSFDAWSQNGVRARVGATHLPLGGLLTAFINAGLVIEEVAELGDPVPDILAVRCSRPDPASRVANLSGQNS